VTGAEIENIAPRVEWEQCEEVHAKTLEQGVMMVGFVISCATVGWKLMMNLLK
jgi:hypothetical protein